ncbi:hypothetical protein D3C86_1963290 [compost metagenome]
MLEQQQRGGAPAVEQLDIAGLQIEQLGGGQAPAPGAETRPQPGIQARFGLQDGRQFGGGRLQLGARIVEQARQRPQAAQAHGLLGGWTSHGACPPAGRSFPPV